MASSKTKAPESVEAYAALEKEFVRGWLQRNPMLGSEVGLHEYDDKLPAPGIEKVQEDIKFLRQFEKKFGKLQPAKLSLQRQIDLQVAKDFIQRRLFELEELRLWERIPEAPFMVGHSVYQILGRSYAPLQERFGAILSRLEKLPKYVKASVSKLKQPSKLFVENELESVTRLAGFFYKIREIGRENLKRRDVKRFLTAVEKTQDAVEELCNSLIIDVLPDAAEEWTLGDGLYRKALKSLGVDRSAEALIKDTEKTFSSLHRKLRDLGRRIRRKTDPEDIRELIKGRHPASFEEVLDFARDTLKRAKQFVVETKYCTGLPKEDLFIVETPAYLRNICPLSTVWPPGRYEDPPQGYLFLTPPDCDSSRLREHNYANLSNMIVRLAYPGRHLQQVMANKQGSVLRAIAAHPLTAMGWSAYSEGRMKECGFDDSPEIQFMQINDYMLDTVRAAADARFWTGRMSAKEAVSYLAVHGGLDWVCAEGEVRRMQVAPTEAAAPFLGRGIFEKMQHDARQAIGPRFSDAFFHDAVLSVGLGAPSIVEQRVSRAVEEKKKQLPKRKAAGRKGRKAKRKKKPARKAKKKPARKKKSKGKTKPRRRRK